MCAWVGQVRLLPLFPSSLRSQPASIAQLVRSGASNVLIFQLLTRVIRGR